MNEKLQSAGYKRYSIGDEDGVNVRHVYEAPGFWGDEAEALVDLETDGITKRAAARADNAAKQQQLRAAGWTTVEDVESPRFGFWTNGDANFRSIDDAIFYASAKTSEARQAALDIIALQFDLKTAQNAVERSRIELPDREAIQARLARSRGPARQFAEQQLASFDRDLAQAQDRLNAAERKAAHLAEKLDAAWAAYKQEPEPPAPAPRTELKGFRFAQDNSTYAVLKRAGDYYAQDSEGEKFISALNPYYRDDPDEEPRRISELQIVYSVECLLTLVENSSGTDVAARLRRELRLRYEKHESSGTMYIWDLDEPRWLLWADMVALRALDVRHRRGDLVDVMTAAEAQQAYGLSGSAVRMAIQRDTIPARKSGETWLVRRTDAESRWGKRKSQTD